MLAEYNYIWIERNRNATESTSEEEDFEWVELPDWDNPGQMKRFKKYKDVGWKIRA